MSDDEIMKALDDEINSCIDNHCVDAFTVNVCLKNMILSLQKENAELRECLKEALSGIDEFMTRTIYFEHGKDIERWRAALEGGNHAND